MVKKVYRKKTMRKRKVSGFKLSVPLKKYILKTIHSNVENKRAQPYFTLRQIGSVANSTNLYAVNLTPNNTSTGAYDIPQGVGQADRIGNTIRIVKATLRYWIAPAPYDITTNPNPRPQEFMIILGNVKTSPGSVPTATFVNSLYNRGDTSVPPNGTLDDLILPFNRDVWNIKKFIRHKVGNAEVSGTGGISSNQFFSNNDFKLNITKTVDITSMMPKVFKFNDTGILQTPGLYMMVESVNASATISGSTVLQTLFNYQVELQYEDA